MNHGLRELSILCVCQQLYTRLHSEDNRTGDCGKSKLRRLPYGLYLNLHKPHFNSKGIHVLWTGFNSKNPCCLLSSDDESILGCFNGQVSL